MIGRLGDQHEAEADDVLNANIEVIKAFYLYREYYYKEYVNDERYSFLDDLVNDYVDLTFSDFVKAYDYYNERYSIDPEDDTFFKYIDELLNGNSLEDALDLVIYSDRNAEIIDDYFLNLEERPTVSSQNDQKLNQPLESEQTIDAYLQKLDTIHNSVLTSAVKESIYNPEKSNIFEHAIYGKGKFCKLITEHGKEKIYILFDSGEKRFNFPDCFASGSLKVIDS